MKEDGNFNKSGLAQTCAFDRLPIAYEWMDEYIAYLFHSLSLPPPFPFPSKSTRKSLRISHCVSEHPPPVAVFIQKKTTTKADQTYCPTECADLLNASRVGEGGRTHFCAAAHICVEVIAQSARSGQEWRALALSWTEKQTWMAWKG